MTHPECRDSYGVASQQLCPQEVTEPTRSLSGTSRTELFHGFSEMKAIKRVSHRGIHMVVPVHIGVEHPNVLWLVVVALLAFGAGLGVNLYRSRQASRPSNESVGGDAW